MANLDSVRPGVRAALRRTHTQAKGVALTRALIALAVSGALLSSMTPAVAQPQNPDDAAIAQAEENVSAGDGEVARLAGSLSSTDAEINRVELEMGALREEVNKSLVDLHDALSRPAKMLLQPRRISMILKRRSKQPKSALMRFHVQRIAKTEPPRGFPASRAMEILKMR